jgi:alcohol dehydrogenase class IV
VTIDLTDYVPHGMIAALGTVVAYVFREHTKQDEKRFDKIADAYTSMGDKLDEVIANQAKNHAKILELLLERKG